MQIMLKEGRNELFPVPKTSNFVKMVFAHDYTI